jgi:hypothetical protein
VGYLTSSAGASGANPIGGSNQGNKLTEQAVTYRKYLQVTGSNLQAPDVTLWGNLITAQYYVKAISTGRYPYLLLTTGGGTIAVTFDPALNTAYAQTYQNATVFEVVSIDKTLTNGWYRLTLAVKVGLTSGGVLAYQLGMRDVFTATSPEYDGFLGSTSKSMTVWGVQLYVGGEDPTWKGPVYYPDTIDDTGYRGLRHFLGRMRVLNPLEWPYINQYSTAFEISELL